MNIQRENWLLSRRHLLRGIGASIALPMLDCMRPMRALSEAAATPKRSIFVYLPNGVNTLDYQIQKSGPEYELTAPLRSLERHRSVMTPISGLHHPNGLGKHHGCQQIWLTGGKVGATERNTVSVDQVMAEETAPLTRFSSLQLSNTGRTLSWNQDGISLPAERKPSEVFKRLFQQPDGGVDVERKQLQRRGSILDAVLDEAKTLDRKMGVEDRTRLDQYLTSVREVEIRTERADAWLDVPRPSIDPSDESRVNKDVAQTNTGEYFRTMYDLMVLAFQTDMTRVATFSSGDEGKGLPIPEININQTRHALSHHNGDPEQLRRLTESDTFNFEQLAYLLDRLKDVQDDHGSLIESTMVLYGSGMAYGHSHGNANLPTIVAGGTKLGLRHGSHIDFNEGHFDGYNVADAQGHYRICSRPLNSDARVSNLLLTLAQKMDVEMESFADSLGTLSELEA